MDQKRDPYEQESEAPETEPPEHWSGDGHEDEELRAHHSSVYLRMMGSMQLAAIGLHGWVESATCCGFPLALGITAMCILIFWRGVLALLEVHGEVSIVFMAERVDWHNPFIYVAYCLLCIGGIGDLVASICGAFGIIFRQAVPSVVLPCWLFGHFLMSLIFTMIISTLNTMDIGRGTTLICCIFSILVVDAVFFFVSLQALMVATWKGTVAPSMADILHRSENFAVKCGSATIDKNHLIMALLYCEDSKHLLEEGGLDVNKLENDLLEQGGIYLAGEKYGEQRLFEAHDPLNYSKDATALLAEAAREQWGAYENRLTADHLVLALTSGGQVILVPKSAGVQNVGGRVVSGGARPTVYPVPKARELREYISFLHRAQCMDPGPPPAPAFGCLPVEECVVVFIVIQALVCLASVSTVLFASRSIALWIGLKTVKELRIVELIFNIIGLVLCSLALFGIAKHREARYGIRQAAHESNGARWAAELDEAWIAVRKDPNAPNWLKGLKDGAKFLSFLLVWSAMKLFLDIPSMLGMLTFGNVCGGYSFGMAKVSQFHLQGEVPMHCNRDDIQIIVAMIVKELLQLYMCWCMFALWHEYAYGWTTTELRGSAYLDPLAPLSQGIVRQLAGLPKKQKKRHADETTPLVV
jgi:hypothetical protein